MLDTQDPFELDVDTRFFASLANRRRREWLAQFHVRNSPRTSRFWGPLTGPGSASFALVRSAAPALDEALKWNAPSFALDGVDVVTLGIERKGGWRIVLHRGAKAKPLAKFRFDDPEKLAAWPAKDRGVVIVRSLDALREQRDAIGGLVARWVAAIDAT